MALHTGRRGAVVAVSVGALVLFSGCSALANGSDGATTALGHVTVENGDDTAHTVHVLVERDSDPVYGTAVTLDGVAPPVDERDFGSIDVRVLDRAAWAGSAGRWTVYTRVDTNTSWQAHPIPADAGGDCYSVRLEVEPDASVTSFTPDCDSWAPSTATPPTRLD